jgi:cystathionine beta-lyase/cystathionine gamma-synthase
MTNAPFDPHQAMADARHEFGQQRAGISSELVRFSIGLTGSIEHRWQQMKEALAVCV